MSQCVVRTRFILFCNVLCNLNCFASFSPGNKTQTCVINDLFVCF